MAEARGLAETAVVPYTGGNTPQMSGVGCTDCLPETERKSESPLTFHTPGMVEAQGLVETAVVP